MFNNPKHTVQTTVVAEILHAIATNPSYIKQKGVVQSPYRQVTRQQQLGLYTLLTQDNQMKRGKHQCPYHRAIVLLLI